jgi:hypothetical protein
MSSTNAPFGLRCVFHPAGEPRLASLKDGILSGYGTSIFTGTPIKRDTNGTLIPTATGADSTIGIFVGCQFTSAGRRFILPYWPAAQTYDAGSMIAQYEMIDGNAIYEGQADGSVAMTANGEGINLVDASAGSVYTGNSSQALNHTTTGATAATFQIVNVADYPDNDWGDTYTIVRVKISTFQGQVA